MYATTELLRCCLAFSLLLLPSAGAQIKPAGAGKIPIHQLSSGLSEQPASRVPARYRIAGKKPSQYAAEDWRKLIDSTWGPGLPTEQKLQIFDDFWNNVDKYYGGFPNLGLNWDSLKNVFRPEVAQGVSRGRFAGIMSTLVLALREGHTLITDLGIDEACLVGSSFRPRGVPIFRISGSLAWGMGATTTPLPDSSLLVIQVDPLQPLGLKAGDVVLGYDGVPWKQLVRQLLDAQLPVGSLIWHMSSWGASPESWTHHLLTSAASNWHLFDSLDVVKYPTGDTVHLPTWKLDDTDWDVISGSFGYLDQLPVKGIPPLNPWFGPFCTWGIIEGTNVGYIGIGDWYRTTSKVSAAVDELMRVRKADGLIIDFRSNGGGNATNLSELGGLFNNNPWAWITYATRSSTTDKMAFTIKNLSYSLPLKDTLYDHPIAVLTGPQCGSIGDWGAFFMRSQPMVRFFGKPASTAYMTESMEGYYADSVWYFSLAKGGLYSQYPGEGHMVHKGFRVDEEVWFAKDDVAKGDDTILKRALEWIGGLAYAHRVSTASRFARGGIDSVTASALLTNPNSHSVSLSLTVSNAGGTVVDSALMMNDGLHGDGLAGDSLWGSRFRAPSTEDFYVVNLRTRDNTNSSSRELPRATFFTTVGPVMCIGDTILLGSPQWGTSPVFRFKVGNLGSSVKAPSVKILIRSLDTLATIVSGNLFTFGDMNPGQIGLSPYVRIAFSQWGAGSLAIPFEFTFSSNGISYWKDTVLIHVSSVGVAEDSELPRAYALEANYPNPFNPATLIRYSIPVGSYHDASLRVYDLLGRVVAVLVNEKKGPGRYEVKFDAAGLASGVYLYQLTAGTFVQTRKMLVVK